MDRRPGSASARSSSLSLLLRTTELGIGFWIDEGLSVGIADRPLGDIPAALRKDGSPPLYYMLLHFWLDLAGDSEEGVRVAQPAVRAARRSRSACWAGPGGLGHAEGGLVRGRPDGLQPVPGAVRAGGADVRDGRAAGDPGDGLLPARPTRWTRDNRRPWIVGFAHLGGARALHPQLADLLRASAAGVALPRAARAQRPSPRAASSDGLLGFGGAVVLYLPWVPTTLYQAAHTGAPWADAPAFGSLLGVPGVLLGRMPEIVLLICAGAGLVALLRTRPLSEHGRAAARAADHRRRSRPTLAWTAVAGLTRVGQPLPRRRAPAVPAARRRRPRLRAPARRRRARAGGDHVGAGHRAGGEEQRARDRPRDRPEPRPGRPGDLHPARDDPGAALLPARRACATRR